MQMVHEMQVIFMLYDPVVCASWRNEASILSFNEQSSFLLLRRRQLLKGSRKGDVAKKCVKYTFCPFYPSLYLSLRPAEAGASRVRSYRKNENQTTSSICWISLKMATCLQSDDKPCFVEHERLTEVKAEPKPPFHYFVMASLVIR